MEKQYKTSESRRKANAKYDAKTYKSIACKCKISDFEKFKSYAEQQNISSMNKLLYLTVNYCINNNIDLSSDTEQNANSNNNDDTADI